MLLGKLLLDLFSNGIVPPCDQGYAGNEGIQGFGHTKALYVETTTTEQLSALDRALGLSETRNAEISREWFTQVANRRHLPAYPAMERHLKRFGRTWLLSGAYRGLVHNGQDSGLAQRIFEEAKSAYHPLTRKAIENILKQADT